MIINLLLSLFSFKCLSNGTYKFATPYLYSVSEKIPIFGSPTFLGPVLLGFCSSLLFPCTFKLKWIIPFLLFWDYLSRSFFSFPRICKYFKKTLQSHQLLLPWASTSWMELTSLLLPFFLFFTLPLKPHIWLSFTPGFLFVFLIFRDFLAEMYCTSIVRGHLSWSCIIFFKNFWISRPCTATKCYSLG